MKFLLLLCLFICSCSQTSKTPEADESFALQITVEPIPNMDSWRVVYQTSRPVTELTFRRQVNRFRSKLFKPLTLGVSIAEENGEEKIISAKPFTTATFQFDSYYLETPKDYEFFNAFSDKSVVMYTGHLTACRDVEKCKDVKFLLTPKAKQHGIVSGQVFTKPFEWIDHTGRGTYVYFGALQPTQTKYLTAVVDHQLPAWLRKRINNLLPKLFAYYHRKTNQPLTFKPFVFVNYQPEGKGTSHKGGTLPGLIQLSLGGSGWQHEDPESFIDLAKFLAHESAHIWNGQLFGGEGMWMHEGGADAFAFRALRDLKIISDQRFKEYQTESFSECVSRSNNRPLRSVTEDPNFTAFYRCGAIFALMTEAAIKNKNPNLDLFSFWNQLFDLAKATDREYTEQMYLHLLDQISGSDNTTAALRRLLDGPIDGLSNKYLSEFERLGIKFSNKSKNFPRTYNMRIARGLLRSLMLTDCNGKHGLTLSTHGIASEGIGSCKAFTKPYLVTAVAGINLVKAGALAYDKVATECKNPNYLIEVEVKNEQKPLRVSCPTSLPQREPYIQLM